jgi:hypothetical protein
MTGHDLRRVGALTTLALGLSCGGGAEMPAASTPAAGTTPATTTTPASTPGTPLVGLKVCDLVPGAEVAKALGGTLELATGQPGRKYGADCMYTVRLAGVSKVVQIWLYPPDQYDVMREGETAGTDQVAGLGDKAYGRRESGNYQLVVEKRGAVTIDARGDTPDQARTVAEVALGKLGK